MLKHKDDLCLTQKEDDNPMDIDSPTYLQLFAEELQQEVIHAAEFLIKEDFENEQIPAYLQETSCAPVFSQHDTVRQHSPAEARKESGGESSLTQDETTGVDCKSRETSSSQNPRSRDTIEPMTMADKTDVVVVGFERDSYEQDVKNSVDEREEVSVDGEGEKIRYRLVKRKTDRKRDTLNHSYNDTGYGKFKGSCAKICPKGSPKPGYLEDPIPAFITINKRQYEDRKMDLTSSCEEKENERREHEDNEEKEEEEDETREGSQKEPESLLDKSQQLDDLNDENSKAILMEAGNLGRNKAVVSERWSNSEEDMDKISQTSYSLCNETQSVLSQTTENDDFIQVGGKRKSNKKKRDQGRKDYDYYEKGKKFENGNRTTGKNRENTHAIIYEAKNKSENGSISVKDFVKSAVQTPAKKSPKQTFMSQTPPTVQNKPQPTTPNTAGPAKTTTTKSKPLSLKSPSLESDTIRQLKLKDIAQKYFDKKLEKDIFEHVSALTEEANRMMEFRILAHKRIDYCLQKIFTGINVQTKIFGSCATGLALPTSDVDICVCGLNVGVRTDVIQYLKTIHDKLKKFKWIVVSKPVLTANVPVIKLEVDPTVNFCELNEALEEHSILKAILEEASSELDDLPGHAVENLRIKIDLTLESVVPMGFTAHLGYKSTDFVQKMLNQHESLYTIAIILKEFLNNRGFLDNYQGGLSSYCLVVMIVAIFRKYGDEGYLKSFKRLINFYGEIFQPEKTGITIVGSDPFFSLNCYYEPAPLWILDNANCIGRNIGQGAFAIKKILAEFGKACKLMKSAQEKIESIAVKNKDKVNCLEDLERLEDIELATLTNSNIIDSLVR